MFSQLTGKRVQPKITLIKFRHLFFRCNTIAPQVYCVQSFVYYGAYIFPPIPFSLFCFATCFSHTSSSSLAVMVPFFARGAWGEKKEKGGGGLRRRRGFVRSAVGGGREDGIAKQQPLANEAVRHGWHA